MSICNDDHSAAFFFFFWTKRNVKLTCVTIVYGKVRPSHKGWRLAGCVVYSKVALSLPLTHSLSLPPSLFLSLGACFLQPSWLGWFVPREGAAAHSAWNGESPICLFVGYQTLYNFSSLENQIWLIWYRMAGYVVRFFFIRSNFTSRNGNSSATSGSTSWAPAGLSDPFATPLPLGSVFCFKDNGYTSARCWWYYFREIDFLVFFTFF